MKIIKPPNERWVQAEGYRKNVMVSADDLKQKGCLAQIVVVGPGSRVKPHHHKKTYELICVLEGQAIVSINGEANITKPHDIFLTEPHDVHSVDNRGDVDWKALVFKTNAAPDDSFRDEMKSDDKS